MSDLEKLAKKAKINRFIKKYAYWGILGLAVLALSLTIILTNTLPQPEVPDNQQQVSTNAVVFSMPVASTTVIKGFSDSQLQYNSTLNCWRAHFGVDLAAEVGSEVFAVLDGVNIPEFTGFNSQMLFAQTVGQGVEVMEEIV